ncbi:MAG: NAD-dependent epimerase/dehydratase family protein [Wenzhouxiangella sp.]
MSTGQGALILVFGASGPVGGFLRARLADSGSTVMAVSRRPPDQQAGHEIWLQQDLDQGPLASDASVLVTLGPLSHALAELDANRRLGRIVALSSASTRFKQDSADPTERALIRGLMATEEQLRQRCAERQVILTLIKPSLIYAPGLDRNVSRVAGLIQRLSVAPYAGRGLRHPVHADDLARLIVDCLRLGAQSQGDWLVGGGETLAYPEMLKRIASANGHTTRPVPVPAWMLKAILKAAHGCGRLKDIRAVMIDRQRQDLLVDDTPARERLGWSPRPFRP